MLGLIWGPILAISSGLVLIVAGRCFRIGRRPYCRSCLFDLTGLVSPTCPECGISLLEKKTTIIGRRRTRLIRSGMLIALVGGVMLAAIGAISLSADSSKPVWLLRAELNLLGPSSEKRIFTELNRRLSQGATNPSEAAAIGEIVWRRALDPPSSTLIYSMLDTLSARGQMPPQWARAVLRRQLLAWPAMNDTDRIAMQPTVTRFLSLYGATWDEMEPIIEATKQEQIADGQQKVSLDAYQYVPNALSSALLVSWWQGGGVGGELTPSQIRTLISDGFTAEFSARPRVEQGVRWLTTNIRFNSVTALIGAPFSYGIHYRVVSTRIDGETIHKMDIYNTAGATLLTGQMTSYGTSITGHSVLLEDVGLGSHTVEADLEIAITDDTINAMASPWPARFNETPREPIPILVDKVLTLRSSFEVVPEGEDTITLIEPGSPGIPTEAQVRGWITSLPLFVNTGGSVGFPPAIELYLTFGPPATSDEEQELTLPINFAWHATAVQGERSWDLGLVRWVAKRNASTQTQVMTKTSRSRLTKDGRRVPYDVEPDPDEPIHVVLTPDPDAARKTVDFTEIWNGTIDLGFFHPIPNPQIPGKGVFSFSNTDFKPLPPLTERP